MQIKCPCCLQTTNEHTRKEYGQVGKAARTERAKQPGWAELYRPLKHVLRTFQSICINGGPQEAADMTCML